MTLKAEATIQVAQLAHQAGDDELAYEILPEGPDGVGDQLWLEEGLELATHLEDNERIARFDARLAELLPHSERLRENRDRRLLMNSREAKSGESHLFTTSGFTDHHLTLQERLSAYEPEYGVAIEEARAWGQDWLELTLYFRRVIARLISESIPRPSSRPRIVFAPSLGPRFGSAPFSPNNPAFTQSSLAAE